MLATFLDLNGTQTPTPGAMVNVSDPAPDDDAFNQSEMLVVANPTNPLNLVGFSHTLTGPITLDVYRSLDAGNTWTNTYTFDGTLDDGLGNVGNRFDPAIAFDANGLLYVAYGHAGQTAAPARPSRLVAATSTDGGLTFGNFQVLDVKNDIIRLGFPDLPGVDRWTIATGEDPDSGNQAAVIAYTQNVAEDQPGGGTANDQRIIVVGTRDGGANWTANNQIINDDSIGATAGGNLAAAPAFGAGIGTGLYVTWWDGGTSIMLDRDTDGLWGNASTFNFAPDILVRNNAGLVNIGPPGPPAQPQRGLKMSPVLAANPSAAHLYVAFQEQFSGNDTDIRFGRSTNLGLNWDFVTVESSTGTDFHPQIAVDEHSNAIAIAYYTTDGDQGGGSDDVRMRIAVSTDFGDTWTKTDVNAQTSNEAGGYTGDYLEYTGLSFRDGTAQVLWASRSAAGANLDAFYAPVGLNSSTNGNVLEIFSLGGASDNIVVQASPQNANYVEVLFNGVREYAGLAASIDSIVIEARGGTDSFSLTNLPAIPVTLYGSVGADTLNINALSGVSGLTLFASDGDDIINLAPNNPFGAAVINSPITINGADGNDTLNIGSGTLDAVTGLVTFDGGADAGGLGDRIILTDTTTYLFFDYTITPTSLTQNFLFGGLNYSNTDRIILHCSNGPNEVTIANGIVPILELYGHDGGDNFIVGGGNVGFQPARIYDGGDGIDAITFDDHLTSSDSTWIIESNFITFFGGVFAVSTQAFESVNCLAGTGNNIIRVVGAMTQNISVDGGGGNDTFNVEHVSNYQDFDASGQGGPPEFHYTMDLDGGSGFNYLTVDDTLDFDRSYSIWPDHMDINEGAPLGLDFDYDSFQSVDVLSPPNPLQFTPYFHIFGTSSDIPFTHQMTIIGSSAADQFILHPHDAQGNLTINGNLGLGGGGGYDTLLVDDTGASLPINYNFYNQFGPGTTNIGGLGAAGFGAGQDIESITINAGNGNDNFTIDSYKSGSALAINGRGGVDRLYVSPNTKNLPIDATFITSFNFDGGDGPDFFYLYNDNNILPWTYTRTADFLRTQTDLGYSVDWNQQSVEYLDVTGGTQADAFLIQSTPPSFQSFSNAFRGAGGNDSYVVGQSGRTNLIVANVALVNDAGDDSATIDDSNDLVGRTAHIDQYFVGGVAGDDLFGPGGYVYHVNLAGALTVQMGSGADTIYARPHQLTSINIQANNPTTAPGDKLTLALAHAENLVITGTTNGNVTSTNLETLTWTGIETLATDATTPTVDIVDVTPDPRTTNVGSIAINFSEAISNFNLAQLTLTRNGGANLLSGTATLTSANQINWTLGNLAGLTNISGNYLLTLTAGTGIADVAGNPLIVGATDSWTANITMGDANGDGAVNIFDVNLVSAHWGEPGPLGDANHDGIVNIFDINLISANWGMGGGGTGGNSGAGASVADLDQSPEAAVATPLRLANAAAEPTSDDRAASRKLHPATVHIGMLSSVGNLKAMLANWGGGGGAPWASERATNPSSVDLVWRSNVGRHDATHTVATESAATELTRPLATVALHPVRTPRQAEIVDAAFRQGRLMAWDGDLLDDLLKRDQGI